MPGCAVECGEILCNFFTVYSVLYNYILLVAEPADPSYAFFDFASGQWFPWAYNYYYSQLVPNPCYGCSVLYEHCIFSI